MLRLILKICRSTVGRRLFHRQKKFFQYSAKIFVVLFREDSKVWKYQNSSGPHHNALQVASFTGMVQTKQAYNICKYPGFFHSVLWPSYRPDNRGVVFRVPTEATHFTFFERVLICSKTHPTSHSMETVSFSTRSKEMRRESGHSLQSSGRGYEWVELFHRSMCLSPTQG